MKIFNIFKSKPEKNSMSKAAYYLLGQNSLASSRYDNPKLAIEGYMRNIIVYRAITLISGQVKRMRCKLFKLNVKKELTEEIKNHPLLTLLGAPYPNMSKSYFLERLTTQKLIYGNNYIEKIYNIRGGAFNATPPLALLPLRPDWISIEEGNNSLNKSYVYQPDRGASIKFLVGVTGKSNIIHDQMFNPNDDHHGLSPIVPAGYSIDVHNEASKWNFSFLRRGASPSGVLEVPMEVKLSPEVFERLKADIDTKMSGSENTGRPLLLEGGMKWIPMSTNPKDGDFIEMKKQVTHEIALAFGLPIETLNTESSKYDNLHAAYEQLYHDQVIPIGESIVNNYNNALTPLYGNDLLLVADFSHTSVMQKANTRMMMALNPITYMTNNEKREKFELPPIEGEDDLPKKTTTFSDPKEANSYIAKEISQGATYSEALSMAELIYA